MDALDLLDGVFGEVYDDGHFRITFSFACGSVEEARALKEAAQSAVVALLHQQGHVIYEGWEEHDNSK